MRTVSFLINLIYLFISLNFFIPDNTVVVVLDVGQGSSTLIDYYGFTILIDTGGDRTAPIKISNYLAPLDKSIELLVITHPHLDHYGGFLELEKKFEIEKVMLFPVCKDSYEYGKLIELIGDRLVLPWDLDLDLIGLDFEVIYPSEKVVVGCRVGEYGYYGSASNINNNSIVIGLRSDKSSLLITGDAEIEQEQYLIESKALDRQYHNYIAGHHCSNTSSSDELLSVISPMNVYCSFGEDNRYKHPGEATINRFLEYSSLVHNTVENGDCEIELF